MPVEYRYSTSYCKMISLTITIITPNLIPVSMKLAYGTLGWHVEYLQPVIRKVENLDGLAFYYGHIDDRDARKRTMETKRATQDLCEHIGIKAIPRKLDDIHDFTNIVKMMKQDIENDIEAGNRIALFNIAGGTKVMCSAALLVCIFKGIPTQYVNEETRRVVPLPLLQADYHRHHLFFLPTRYLASGLQQCFQLYYWVE